MADPYPRTDVDTPSDPATPSGPYTRQDIWTLQEQDPFEPITLAYALAVREMQTRAATDPTGWVYQAAVHALPEPAPTDIWRNQCQHNTWFFLPWHRMYIYWFERIVRSIVVTLPNIPDETKQTWALPFWDYGRADETRALPPAFRAENLPDGSDNPLFITQRDRAINAGGRMDPRVTSAAIALSDAFIVFARDATTPLSGFGGAKTAWHHFAEPGGRVGALESTPHNSVHGAVGGPGGFMSNLSQAPLDPIFWLHHCNIDRLWEVWRNLGGGRVNPPDTPWLGEDFHFHDEAGQDVQDEPGQVQNTESDLGYVYSGVAPPPVSESIEAMAADRPEGVAPPERIGAISEPLELAGKEVSVVVSLDKPAALESTTDDAPGRLYLDVGDIEGEVNPGISYAVHVEKEGAGGSEYVGNVTFFGIEETKNLDKDHPGGHGLHHTFDVTDAVARLGVESPESLSVRFEPLTVEPPPGEEALEATQAVPPVTIGSVSFFRG